MGVILAGGAGRRIGGAKATVALHGQPLITYPLLAMKAALGRVAVIAKPDTELPELFAGVEVWIERGTVQHPLVGLIEALRLAAGRPVVACAVDLPFVTPDLIEALADADPRGAPGVVAARRGELQPLLGCYQPRAAGLLAAFGFEGPLRAAVAALEPERLEVSDDTVLFNVNVPEDLLTAAAMLDSGQPNVKS